MIFTGDIPLGISINGIPGFIAKMSGGSKIWFQLLAPQTDPDDIGSCYNLSTHIPTEDDQSPFAVLYRYLKNSVAAGELEGPYGQDHPLMFNKFDYLSRVKSIKALLTALEEAGFSVKVTRLCRTSMIPEAAKDKEDIEIDALRVEFSEWIDENTKTDLREPSILSSCKNTKKDSCGILERLMRLLSMKFNISCSKPFIRRMP